MVGFAPTVVWWTARSGQGLYQSGDVGGGGIRVTEQAAPAAALQPAPSGVVAFVGRTLRGPVDTPVAVRSFSEFERAFGGLWQPAPLSYLVAHFFANGGSEAVVVRVVNAARPATLALPTAASSVTLAASSGPAWCLAARHPGTREFLRVAVDYDGLGADETDEFNLLVQRLRSAGSEVVDAQEYHLRVSAVPGTPRFLGDLLEGSALVRCVQAAPGKRPLATPARQWVISRPDGDDGLPPTDHDLIGSRDARTGIFSLVETSFQWLVLPPRDRELPVGAAAWFVAARFCAEQQAMVLVDPPAEWGSAGEALHALAAWPLRSPSAAMWFPWITVHDPLRNEVARFPPSGAVAGMLSRQECQQAPWQEAAQGQALPPLRPGHGLALTVSPLERVRLGALGVNVPSTVRVPRGHCPPQVTLAAPVARSPYAGRLLYQRRLQALGEALLRGTRWVLFLAEPGGNVVWRQVARQVGEWLARSTGRDSGAEAGWFVVCDRRLNPEEAGSRGLRFLFGLRDPVSEEWHAFLVSHTAAGSELRPASLNSWALPRRQTADAAADGRASAPADSRQTAGVAARLAAGVKPSP